MYEGNKKLHVKTIVLLAAVEGFYKMDELLNDPDISNQEYEARLDAYKRLQAALYSAVDAYKGGLETNEISDAALQERSSLLRVVQMAEEWHEQKRNLAVDAATYDQVAEIKRSLFDRFESAEKDYKQLQASLAA